jgi:hypothetical protein
MSIYLLCIFSLLGGVNCQTQIWPMMFISNQTDNGICIQGSFSILSGFCEGHYSRRICARDASDLERLAPVTSAAIAAAFPKNYSETCIRSLKTCSNYNLKVGPASTVKFFQRSQFDARNYDFAGEGGSKILFQRVCVSGCTGSMC